MEEFIHVPEAEGDFEEGQGEHTSEVGRISIVTDSAANLPPVIVDHFGITVVPVYLHLNSGTYRDGIDISAEEVYRRLRETKRIPKTAAPSVGDFLQTYLRLGRDADTILSIHIPEKLSGTVASARMAADLVKDHVQVQVVDCGTAAMGAGFVALAAARAAARGEDLDGVMKAVEQVSSCATVFAMIDTLEYLYRGGRIGKAEALLGITLKIKPILTIKNQEVDVLAKARTTSRGIKIMLEEMRKQTHDRPVHVAILHADAMEAAHRLKELVQEQFECIEIFTCSITPVMGAHTGPGLLGIAFYAEDES
jgi:DegV family protein with EDD domain